MSHDDDAVEVEPTPPHVQTIARITTVIGLGLCGLGFVAAWPLLFKIGCAGFFASAFVSLYGLCVWLAARTALATS